MLAERQHFAVRDIGRHHFDFRDAFRRMDRVDQFSYEGAQLLFDYLESYEQDTGERIELDVIALCCDYTEDDAEAIAQSYNIDISDVGRACCGGRQLCRDQNYRHREYFVPNQFTGWHCSVDHFFLHIKQVNGEVYFNKDCKMNFEGTHGPIGTLDNPQQLLTQAQNPAIIKCANKRCYCGLCAPKAKELDTYHTMMKKYEIPTDNLL